ncbi:B12-binding domain-containing protein [Candidatus Riflebacteria bacterium]
MEEWRKLVNMIVEVDTAGAEEFLNTWAAEHGYESMMRELLGPALHEMGEMWKGEFASVAHAYVAAEIAQHALENFIEQKGSRKPDKGPVVLGNIEDDYHSLGREMVVSFLRVSGWEVIDLGVDVEAKTFVDEAVKVGAKVIGVSAMIYTTALNVHNVRRELDSWELGGKIKLAAGGAVFRVRPELLEEVGADGPTTDAFGAPALFTNLWEQAVQAEGKNE